MTTRRFITSEDVTGPMCPADDVHVTMLKNIVGPGRSTARSFTRRLHGRHTGDAGNRYRCGKWRSADEITSGHARQRPRQGVLKAERSDDTGFRVGTGLFGLARAAGPDRDAAPRADAWPSSPSGAGLRAAALWDGVKDRLHDSALALSGGQQQRLCIARARSSQAYS